jgi:YegS/Rv2252/BmrU family lipid kinase
MKPPSERIAIFANPIAGRGKGKSLAERLRLRFEAEGWNARLCFDRPQEVQQIDDITAAVSIGGDGTLRAVVDRVTDGGRAPGPGVLVVPMGTANLMGRHLGIDLKGRKLEERAVSAIRARNVKHLDAGRLTSTADGQSTTHLFLLVVGIGIDGEVVHALDRVRKGPINFASYVIPGLGALANFSFTPIEVEVDGRRVFRRSPAVAFVGNIPEYGTGFPILPLAKSDDGLLDVCVLPAKSATDLIEHAVASLAGEHHLREGAVYVKGTRVTVRADQPVAVQADGDPAGFTPAEIELLPTRIAFLVPP